MKSRSCVFEYNIITAVVLKYKRHGIFPWMNVRPLCPLTGSSGTGGQKCVDQGQGRDFTDVP